MKKFLYRSILFLFVFFQVSYCFLALKPQEVQAAVPFATAYATLSSSRFSYKASLASAIAANGTFATISSSGQSDNNTDNLFPKDVVCLNGSAGSGCIGSTTFTVNSIPDSTSFGFTPSLGANTASAGDYVVASQSARITITFTPTTSVASGEYVRVKIAAASSNYSNGIPDSTGFDSSLLTTGNINTYITPTSFTKSATSLTYSSGYHVILMTLSSALVSGTSYSFVIGDASDPLYRFLNPSPTGTSHVRGVADVYSIVLNTEDAGNDLKDSSILKVANIDGVLVSANVEMTLTYTINDASNGYSGNVGNGVDVTQCRASGNWTTTSASTATAVPFGSITAPDTQFYQVAQTHYITTNAEAGFDLTVQADAVMYKDGDSGLASIPNTLCGATNCTDTSPQVWTDYAGYNGLGYTLGNITGSEASFTYTFKPFSTTARNIMSKSTKSSGSRIASCYRLSVDTAQDTGYYFNKLTYIAIPKF